ncbi:MAG: 50S ribosomal protein L6 [Patescibacteria group bacterium]|nr:50S ribosomal protein L6 [Patescibacteria group bacterium]
MSRIGKKPIDIPAGVEAKMEKGEFKVKGSKGELSFQIRPEIEVVIKDNQIITTIKEETKQSNAFWGLTRSLIFNAVQGVTKEYEKQLEIQGVGYKARVEGEEIILEVGFSHLVKIKKPEGIEFTVAKNIITISGISKQLVGEMAAQIRAVKPPEPYKGKGIRYVGEEVIRKVGKRAADAAS